MNRSRALRIGNRINLVLLRQLDQGCNVRRLIDDPLYARDVLFVCDAMPGTDLVALARDFRGALEEAPEQLDSPPWSFDVTRPATDSELPAEQAARRRKDWFTPMRWLAR
jgi:hypothetical protein